jgi:hypothetical protein
VAIASTTVWEVRSASPAAATNGGGFDVGNASMDNTITATLATSASPVITWTNYTFASTDVGMLLFIKSGTNWIPGWYPIAGVGVAAGVSAGQAVLNAAAGAVQLYGGATILNTAVGCATTASPTAGTGSIDYTQSSTSTGVWTTSAGIALTAIGNAGTATQITTASPAVGVNWIGNMIYVATGSGFTTSQRVQVSSVAAGVATIASNSGTLGGTSLSGGTGTLGGACLTIGDPIAATSNTAMVSSNRVFVNAGSGYTISASIACSVTGVTPSKTVPPNWVTGYGTYRGDGVQPVITLSGSTLDGFNPTTTGWRIENFKINCAAQTASRGISSSNQFMHFYNIWATNFTAYGIYNSGYEGTTHYCQVTGGTSAATAGIYQTGAGVVIDQCYVHDNACSGINIGVYSAITNCIVANNTGTTSDGIITATAIALVRNCTVYGNERHGINNAGLFGSIISSNLLISNGQLASNGGYGLVGSTAAGVPARPGYDGNAYFNNKTNPREYCNDLGSTNPVDGVAPYVDVLDVTLTADPFVHASQTLADGNTTGLSTNQFASSTYTFVSSDVGSTIFILNSTGGWTANQQFTINSVLAGVATLNGSPGTTGLTGATWHFDNYQLNATPGGGAACVGYGTPASWLGTASVSYPTMGALVPPVANYFAF